MKENVFRDREVLIPQGHSHEALQCGSLCTTEHNIASGSLWPVKQTAYGGLEEAVVSPRSTYKHPASAHPVPTDPR